MSLSTLGLDPRPNLRAANAGLFVSRGKGLHPTRVIDSYELILVRSGVLCMAESLQPAPGARRKTKGIGLERERNFEVKAGQSLLLWPGRRHRGTQDYSPELSFYWLHFHVQGRQRGSSAPLQVPQLATLADPERLAALLHRFLDDQESGRLQPLSAALLILLMLQEVSASAVGVQDHSDAATALAARIESYIQTHFGQALSTADIAQHLDCNPDYLGRVFRRVTGQTIVAAIQRRRLRQAQRLLLESSLNINQIARECGFDDAGYFRRLFRRQLGVSPKAHRRLHARLHVNTV